ncbi:hypothetical protein GCM10020000_15590 [Streptomyces olivoverticillatus]
MRIGEAARAAGVTAKAVRYYESLGLIAPGRLANGYRDYDEHDVRLLREVKALGRLGIPAERTRPFLECLAAGMPYADDCPASLAGYHEAIGELDRRIAELTARRAALAAHLRHAAYRGSSAPQPEGDPVHDPYQLPVGLPVPEDDGGADHLPGRALPPVELPGTAGESVRLDALGPGRTVLYVYPPDRQAGRGPSPGVGRDPRGARVHDAGVRLPRPPRGAGGGGGRPGCSACPPRRRGISGRWWSGSGCPSRCCRIRGWSWRGSSGCRPSRPGGVPLFRRLTMIVRDGIVEHVFYPVFPPDRHAEQVLAWLRTTAGRDS